MSSNQDVKLWCHDGRVYAQINDNDMKDNYKELSNFYYYGSEDNGDKIFKLVGIEVVQFDSSDVCILYRHYPNQTSSQKCYLELELNRDIPRLSCCYDAEIGGGIPFTKYNKQVESWRIPCLKAEYANELMYKVANYAGVIANGYTECMISGNVIGTFNDSAKDARDKIEQIIESEYFGDYEKSIVVYEAEDFLPKIGCKYINSETTDEDLDKLVEVCLSDAEDNGIDIVIGVRKYFERIRASRMSTEESGF